MTRVVKFGVYVFKRKAEEAVYVMCNLEFMPQMIKFVLPMENKNIFNTPARKTK